MRILLITLSNIGDAVMTTPVLEALHGRYGDAAIDIVTDRRAAALFEHCPYRGEIVIKEKTPRLQKALALARRLRKTRYDLVVDLRTDGLSLLLSCERRLTRKRHRLPGEHAVEQHFRAVRDALGADSIPPLRLWTDDNLRRRAHEALHGLPGNRWLAIASGARGPTKRWPAERFAETVSAVAGCIDAVILLGSNDDSTACAQVEHGLEVPARNLCGQTTLPGTVAVLESTSAFLGNDSGPGHMAAACGIPTLTLFGPGDPQRYRPWHPQARWLQADSGKVGDVSVSDVTRSVLAMLAEGRQQ